MCWGESQAWALWEMNSLKGTQALGRVGVHINIKAKAAHGYTRLIWYHGLSDTQTKYKVIHRTQGSWYELNSLHRLNSMWGKTHLKKNDLISEASALSTHEFDSKSSSINCPGALHTHLVTDHWILLYTIVLFKKCSQLTSDIYKI